MDRVKVRGRAYENGPFSFCDHGEVHAQPCTCAMSPALARVADVAAELNERFADVLPEGVYFAWE